MSLSKAFSPDSNSVSPAGKSLDFSMNAKMSSYDPFDKLRG